MRAKMQAGLRLKVCPGITQKSGTQQVKHGHTENTVKKKLSVTIQIRDWLLLSFSFNLFGLIKMHVSIEMVTRARFTFHMDNLQVISHRDYFLSFKNSFAFTCGGFLTPYYLTSPLS